MYCIFCQVLLNFVIFIILLCTFNYYVSLYVLCILETYVMYFYIGYVYPVSYTHLDVYKRQVFDGSAKTTNNLSLNDTLMVGPMIQQDLFSIMVRFRTHRYALIADIEKMYRQIMVNPKDSNRQRIVWRDAPHKICDITL